MCNAGQDCTTFASLPSGQCFAQKTLQPQLDLHYKRPRFLSYNFQQYDASWPAQPNIDEVPKRVYVCPAEHLPVMNVQTAALVAFKATISWGSNPDSSDPLAEWGSWSDPCVAGWAYIVCNGGAVVGLNLGPAAFNQPGPILADFSQLAAIATLTNLTLKVCSSCCCVNMLQLVIRLQINKVQGTCFLWSGTLFDLRCARSWHPATEPRTA